jgi:hypothetical protein
MWSVMRLHKEPIVLVPASFKSRQKGNTVSDEMVKCGYWVLMT